MPATRRRPLYTDDEKAEIVKALLSGRTQRKIAEELGRNKEVPNKISIWMRTVLKNAVEGAESELSLLPDQRSELLYRLINVMVDEDGQLDDLIVMLLMKKARKVKRKNFDIASFHIVRKM